MMPSVRQGDRFEATRDIKKHGLSQWRAPFTGSFETTIPKGTVLVADYDHVKGARGFSCVPERYAELEPVLVPDDTRLADTYNGYHFVFLLSDIDDDLRRLPDRAT
jgi:hypothetical protein